MDAQKAYIAAGWRKKGRGVARKKKGSGARRRGRGLGDDLGSITRNVGNRVEDALRNTAKVLYTGVKNKVFGGGIRVRRVRGHGFGDWLGRAASAVKGLFQSKPSGFTNVSVPGGFNSLGRNPNMPLGRVIRTSPSIAGILRGAM